MRRSGVPDLFCSRQPRLLLRVDSRGAHHVDVVCGLRRPRLHYLSHGGAFRLADGVGLVGHDGWADGRFGDFERSVVSMYDFKLIKNLAGLDKRQRVGRCSSV